MNRNVCVVQDFLTEEHKAKIRDAAAQTGFSVRFFTAEEQEAAKAFLPECEVLYAQLPDVLRAAPATLKWYACSAAGVDPYCADPSIFRNPDCLLTSANVYGVTIAEHVIMVTLMLLRRMTDYQEPLQKHQWPSALGMSLPPIRSIRDGAFTILGTGNIGRNVAARLHSMGAASVTGFSRGGWPVEDFDAVFPIAELDKHLPETTFLIMALPGTPDTFHLLDRRRIALLPKEAYVVNVGRGSAIEQSALADALNSGAIAGAALDVMTPEPLPVDDPLWDAKNLILTPHVSGNMTLGYTREENVRLFCENLSRYAEGQSLKGLVDRTRGY